MHCAYLPSILLCLLCQLHLILWRHHLSPLHAKGVSLHVVFMVIPLLYNKTLERAAQGRAPMPQRPVEPPPAPLPARGRNRERPLPRTRRSGAG